MIGEHRTLATGRPAPPLRLCVAVLRTPPPAIVLCATPVALAASRASMLQATLAALAGKPAWEPAGLAIARALTFRASGPVRPPAPHLSGAPLTLWQTRAAAATPIASGPQPPNIHSGGETW
eukprot:2218448-Pleurochrysis_carterae.AAC.1